MHVIVNASEGYLRVVMSQKSSTPDSQTCQSIRANDMLIPYIKVHDVHQIITNFIRIHHTYVVFFCHNEKSFQSIIIHDKKIDVSPTTTRVLNLTFNILIFYIFHLLRMTSCVYTFLALVVVFLSFLTFIVKVGVF